LRAIFNKKDKKMNQELKKEIIKSIGTAAISFSSHRDANIYIIRDTKNNREIKINHYYAQNRCTAEISEHEFSPITYTLNPADAAEILSACEKARIAATHARIDADKTRLSMAEYARANTALLAQTQRQWQK